MKRSMAVLPVYPGAATMLVSQEPSRFGLQLEPGKASIEVVVAGHADRPAEN
jgi:hypothetical protein